MTDEYFDYDVGLSFAGEQRDYVKQVASALKSRGIRTFYDDYEEGTLWGKDLYAHLSEVYQHLCRYCVIFVSKEYAAKVWPNVERKSAQARALEEKKEYILPARFDDTDIPGVLSTVSYVDLNTKAPEELADLILAKVGIQQRKHYLPPNLDRLFERLGITDDIAACDEAAQHASAFFSVLRRMTTDERKAVTRLIQLGCPEDLPENLHLDADLLRRHTGLPVARLKSLLGGVGSLGFSSSIREGRAHDPGLPGTALGDTEVFYLQWINLARGEHDLPALVVAGEMILGATADYCAEHGAPFLERLDFSQLASATASRESQEPEESHEPEE